MTKAELQALAARCEAATGADRELDCRIFCAKDGLSFEVASQVVLNLTNWVAPAYTASLDAAMTLKPAGWRIAELGETVIKCPDPWAVRLFEKRFDGRGKSARGDGATPALALTAACLRAIAEEIDDV